MGIIADLLSAPSSIDVGGTDNVRVARDRVVHNELTELIALRGDMEYPTDLVAKDEVQSIAVYTDTVTDGTFALTVTLKNGETFTTDAIAYNANAATIETAIDTAATAASITDWTNGDISVAGGDLTTAPVTLTFDGDSVTNLNHPLTTIDGTNLVGDGDAGAVTATTEGQTNRPAWAVLKATGAIAGTMPAQGVTPTAVTVGTSRAANPRLPSAALLRALCAEAAIENEDAATEAALIAVLGL